MFELRRDEGKSLVVISEFAQKYCFDAYYNNAIFFFTYNGYLYYELNYSSMELANAYFNFYLPFYYKIDRFSIPVLKGP